MEKVKREVQENESGSLLMGHHVGVICQLSDTKM